MSWIKNVTHLHKYRSCLPFILWKKDIVPFPSCIKIKKTIKSVAYVIREKQQTLMTAPFITTFCLSGATPDRANN